MTKEVAGVLLSSFETPIHDSLGDYEILSGGRLQFDRDNAPFLDLTPDKPNSARSITDVNHLGRKIGKLFVIAFAPFDGTGDEKTYRLEDLSVAKGLPSDSKIVPRSKLGVHSEIHLTLAGKFTESNGEPIPLAGLLDLVGFTESGEIGGIGRLGQNLTPFVNALQYGKPPEPTASLSVGENYLGEREGDPHAVYNRFGGVVQVAGFLAISNEIAERHAGLVNELGAQFRT